jgi:WD40 repeat protein/serine/threonine protein kinase
VEANLVGRRLGEFVVREAMSSGGFGMVFRAEQPALAREAVIKVMHTRLRASERLIQRFLREARLASRLDHPYGAHIYAFGAESDGMLWIAMELVRGTPLDRLLEAQGPISLERFVPLLERLCEVVQTAHDQGIVHRDLKPANVMVLARAGQLLPKLLDLGIAKLSDEDLARGRASSQPSTEDVDDDEAFAETVTPTPVSTDSGDNSSGRLTEEGAVMGSPLYMAPEQWMDAATVDARTDIYALGVLSYEALTGKAPFTGSSRHQIAIAHATADPPKLGGELPAALDAVLARALAKQPEQRFGSALELAAAFRKASGLAEQTVALPKLPDELRAAVLARAPQPIAQATGALEAARNPHQARDAVWQLVRVVVRYVAVVALSAHAHVGSRGGDARSVDAVRRLRRRALADAEWLSIARELVLPFAKLRDAYPIPELVDFFTGTAATPLTDLLALRDTSDGGASDDGVRELLQTAFPLLERMFAGLGVVTDYRLAVPSDGGARVWAGVRRAEQASVELRGRAVHDGHPVLVDASGLPLVTLWPFVQVHEPARGVGDRLVFLEGTGRRGARLIALPEPFEHEDEGLWDAIGALAEDTQSTTSGQEHSPYPGLSAFTSDDAALFFGRERETEEVVNRLRAQPLLAVVGPSGAGKSSFVHAGVVPSLPEDWQVISFRPGAVPLTALAARLGKLGLDPVTMRGEIKARPASLGEQLAARGKGTVVIVVDQFEELFTLCENATEREQFVEALVGAASTGDDPVRVVLTLRDDFLLHAEALSPLRTRLAASLHLLTTPGRDDLLRILSEPLKRAGYELDEPALAGEMADALSGARSALALLSFTASKLWELRDRRYRQLTRKAYVSLGGIGGALARHAEATLDAMLPDEQRLVREVFRHAVTAEGTRAVLPRDDLDQLLGDDRHGPAVIEKLVTARLLVSSEGPTGGEQIEITHEALIEAWPRLVAWRSEDAEGTRLRDQLRATARQWDERKRPSGLLWRGDALAEYRLWRSRYPGALTDLETAFATSSIDDAARSLRRRRSLLAGSFGVLAAGLIALFVLNRRVADERTVAEKLAADNKAQAEQMHDNLLASYEAQARQYLLDGEYDRALTYIGEARKLGAHGPALDLVAASVASRLTSKTRTFAHDSPVFDARFSADGTRLVTAGGREHRARVWSIADGKLIAELVHGGDVFTAQFEPGGQVLTMSADGTAALFDPTNGARLATFDPHVEKVGLRAVVPSPDGEQIVTVLNDDEVWQWDRTGKLVRKLNAVAGENVEGQIAGPCGYSPDGALIAVGDPSGTLRVWNAHTGVLVGSVKGHTNQINTVVFSGDGTRIVTASDDKTAAVWDAVAIKLVVRIHHDDAVNTAMFSPDGKSFATASNDHTAQVWSATTGDRLLSLEGHVGGVNAVTYSPDGTQLATISDDSTVMLWDAATGRRESHLRGHSSGVSRVQYDPRGAQIATASVDKTAIVWSSEPQQRAVPLVGHKGYVLSGAFSPDGTTVATSDGHGSVRLWDRATGQQRGSLAIEGRELYCARFSADGTRLAIGANDGMRLWDPATGHVDMLPGASVHDLEWSVDGQLLLSGSEDAIARTWSRDGKPRASFKGHDKGVYSAGFSPNGDRLVTTSLDHTTRFWSVATGEQLARWDGDFLQVRFEPTGELLAGRNYGLEAMIWRADDREHKSIAQMKHDSPIMDIHWSSHGDFIVTASLDATVRVWDRNGQLLMKLGDGHTQWWRAQFSRDDRYIVSTGADGAVVVWELPPPAATLDQLLRCKVYELRGDKLVFAARPADCT